MNKTKIVTIIIVLLFFIINIYIKNYKLDSIPGINSDEAWIGYTAKLINNDGIAAHITGMGNYTGVIYPFICSIFYKIFGSSLFISRLICVLSNILVIIFFIAVLHKENHIFLILLILLYTLNPFLFMYSRWAMPHGLIPLFNIISFYFAVKFFQKEKIIFFLLSLFTAALSIQLHPMQILLVLFLICYAVIFNNKLILKIIFNKLFLILCLIFVIATSSVLIYNSNRVISLIKLDVSYILNNNLFLILNILSGRIIEYFLKYFDTFNGIISLKYFSGSVSITKYESIFLKIISILIFLISIYQIKSKSIVKKTNALLLYFLFFTVPLFLETFNQNMNLPHLGEERYLLIQYPFLIFLYAYFIFDLFCFSKKFLKIIPIFILTFFCFIWCRELYYDYFCHFKLTGGTGENVYFISKQIDQPDKFIDAKLLAFNKIVNDISQNKIIVCQDYWIYWVIKYHSENNYEVKWSPGRKHPREWKSETNSIIELNSKYANYNLYYVLWSDLRNEQETDFFADQKIWCQIDKVDNTAVIDIYKISPSNSNDASQ